MVSVQQAGPAFPGAPAAPADAALLAAYARGDAAAARMLALRHLPRLVGYATRILGGDRAEAEDVAQEAMLRLWRIAPDWRDGEAEVSTWLYRVAANLCTDRLRRRMRRGGPGLDEVPEMPDGSPDIEARLIAGDRLAALQAALDRLPERQRQAVVLRHIEGLANPAIAGILGIGVEAVESLTARGKRALAALLEGRRAELGFEGEG
ncbi:MAG TPA: RNA polymerase sigma factor [Paracoccaceae bacterium]|nr:RNA polymerase sigma factor [Paracoccaceae bacterium]HMO70677.1 RNA polymerase sigma factor [Paracoccaceae bacterium]